MKWYPEHKCFADEDAFDENGILQPGKRLRHPQYMMDSAASGNPVPQWALDKAAQMLGRDAATTPDWQQRQNIYNCYKLDISNRWHGGGVESLRAGDVVSGGIVKSHDNGRLVIADASKLDSETIKQQMYDAYDHDISTAWMRDRNAEAGGSCTVNGQTGKWRKDNDGKLVCCPDKAAHEFEMAGPLSDSKRYAVRDEAYSQYEADLQNAWRR